MARMGEYHNPGCGVVGKCSVPMWQGGCPSGFCDDPAYGQQYEAGTRHAPPWWSWRDRNGYWVDPTRIPPFAMGFCCPNHGGPAEDGIRFVRDGDQWCAFRPGFENLQESVAGFGITQPAAEADLVKQEKTDVD